MCCISLLPRSLPLPLLSIHPKALPSLLPCPLPSLPSFLPSIPSMVTLCNYFDATVLCILKKECFFVYFITPYLLRVCESMCGGGGACAFYTVHTMEVYLCVFVHKSVCVYGCVKIHARPYTSEECVYVCFVCPSARGRWISGGDGALRRGVYVCVCVCVCVCWGVGVTD
ncbi:unnamed protein product [Arctogadus glacialis]